MSTPRCPPPFEQLQTSTKTVMCYTNLHFNLQKVFDTLPVVSIAAASLKKTKKQKNIDKKKLRAPPGAIISVQYKKYLRGVHLRKMKKYQCPRCLTTNEKGKPVEDVSAVYPVVPIEEPGFRRETYATLRWHCGRCDRFYPPQLIGRKKIDNFLNQTTIVLFLEDPAATDGLSSRYLNIMMFKNSLKIAGCKSDADAITAIATLWDRFVPGSWTLVCETRPLCVFEVVMRNVGFNLGFGIDRIRLNYLMNEPRFADWVDMSQFEPTGQTNVNIKMHAVKPAGFMYDCLVFPPPAVLEYYREPPEVAAAAKKGRQKASKYPAVVDNHRFPQCPCAFLGGGSESAPYLVKVPDLYFKKDQKKKDLEAKYVTFIVFSSSQTILSGRYYANVEEMYNFFVATLLANKSDIMERVAATE